MSLATNHRIPCSVRIQNVSKFFGSFQVLSSVRVDIQGGEFFTLLGPSGCGKTTLLRVVAGFLFPEKGSVFFNERDVTFQPPWRRNVGFVFQNYALWPHMNVYENIAYGLKIRRQSKEVIDKKVRWALELVGLPGVEKRFPGELSGGMQQRVALARALVVDPDILLLDEPLSNLDAKLRITLRDQLREIQKQLHITTIYVTHDQEEALEISDRIAVMNAGVIQQIGKPEDIYNHPANLFVANFVGKSNLIDGYCTPDGYFESSAIEGLRLPLESNKTMAATKAVLIVRPERIRFASSDEPVHFQGVITKKYFLGNITRYLITNEQASILIETNNERLDIGETVKLTFSSFHIIPKEETDELNHAIPQ